MHADVSLPSGLLSYLGLCVAVDWENIVKFVFCKVKVGLDECVSHWLFPPTVVVCVGVDLCNFRRQKDCMETFYGFPSPSWTVLVDMCIIFAIVLLWDILGESIYEYKHVTL